MEDQLVLNGLNGGTGRYLLPAIPESTVGRVAREEEIHPPEVDPGPVPVLPVDAAVSRAGSEDFDKTNLAEAGWAVVFADDAPPSIAEALRPLLEHRRASAAAVTDRFRQFAGPDGHRAGETAARFLRRHGVDPGEAPNPAKVPHYVLIVGDPQRIPFRFQYLLDVDRAVGRLHFDTDEEYARYAQSVIAAEGPALGGATPAPRTAAFFATRNADDVATRMSADLLVAPLAGQMEAQFPEWTVHRAMAADATKARLTQLVGRDEKPAFLFTASHGLFFDQDHPDQLRQQGALVSQDWPGPVQFGAHPFPPDFFFSADDVADDADVRGMVAFFFACFGAGTPRTDDFMAQATDAPAVIAPHAFVARLPQRLLAHPRGGALAVIGHVDRAWPSSFNSPAVGVNIEAFSNSVARLLRSQPVGAAMEPLNLRHARLTQALVNEREAIDAGRAAPDLALLATLYKARNDARNYAVFGDPAVRIAPGSA